MPQTPWWRTFDRRHWQVFIISSLAWFFDCLDQQVFNQARDGAVASLIADKARATELASYTTSFLLIGWAVGGFIFGALGDRFGRARVLAITLVLYSVGTGLSAFAPSYAVFCVFLVLTGLGIGGVFGLAVALVADSVPDQTRAPALGMLQALSTVGNITGGLIGLGIAFLIAASLLPFGLERWQVLFLVGAVPAFLCVFLLLRLPEPEKWVRAREEGLQKGIKFGSYAKLLGERRWARHSWAGLVMCCAGIIGLWGLGNFHPKIVGSIVDAHLSHAGLSAASYAGIKARWIAVGILLLNGGGFIGMVTLAKLAQVLGRKPAFAISILCSFLFSQLAFRYMRNFEDIFWMLPLMGFGTLCTFAVYAIYLPELFPIHLRSTGTSFCYNFGRLAAATAPFTIGILTKRLGGDIEGFRTAGLWVSLVLLLGL
ncbi:MAG TPA: MFS transporter, partial [Bryobacteraceae bacterium]|nr:MFS transporter [Bryobacteraceae bacterium]